YGLSLHTHAVILALTLFHLCIDLTKIRLAQKTILNDGAIAYVADQLLHFASVAFAARLLAPNLPFAEVAALLSSSRAIPSRLLFVPVIYVGVIFGGGCLIRALTRPLAKSINLEQPEKGGEPMQNAGLYIGWLERFLLLTALLLQSP